MAGAYRIEVVVLSIGWILGGTVGLGTLLIALAMGPLVQWFLRFTTVRLDGDRYTNVPDCPDGHPSGRR